MDWNFQSSRLPYGLFDYDKVAGAGEFSQLDVPLHISLAMGNSREAMRYLASLSPQERSAIVDFSAQMAKEGKQPQTNSGREEPPADIRTY